jgi:muconolactone delta-isomerase
MKYLVLFKPEPSAPRLDDPLSANKAAAAYTADMQKKGNLVAAFGFVGGGGIGILEAASHEELWDLVYAYPLYSVFRWEVEPLVDVTHLFGRGIALLEQAAKK